MNGAERIFGGLRAGEGGGGGTQWQHRPGMGGCKRCAIVTLERGRGVLGRDCCGTSAGHMFWVQGDVCFVLFCCRKGDTKAMLEVWVDPGSPVPAHM